MTDYIETRYKSYTTDHTLGWPPVEFTHLRMDPTEKQEWIDALLSGDFEQGKHVLNYINGGSCCLGVWCEVAKIPKEEAMELVPINGVRIPMSVWRYGDMSSDGIDAPYTSATFIPRNYGIALYDTRSGMKVSEFFGRDTLFHVDFQGPENFKLDDHRLRNIPINLPVLNDDGFTFAQIADVIRYFL